MTETKEEIIFKLVLGHNFVKRLTFNKYVAEYLPELVPFAKECWKKGYLSARPYCYVTSTRKLNHIVANQAYNQTLNCESSSRKDNP